MNSVLLGGILFDIRLVSSFIEAIHFESISSYPLSKGYYTVLSLV